jgi:hypothetical protein
LTNCSATTSVIVISNGANAYGGGVSVAVGAYSYSGARSSGGGSIGIVSGSTMVSDTSYDISSNTLTNCGAAWASFTTLAIINSNGANIYGGGISVALGAYSYTSGIRCPSRGSVSGNTVVSNTSYSISSNTLTNCTATLAISYMQPKSVEANMYGGGISVAVGACSYSVSHDHPYSISGIGGNTTVSDTDFIITNNALTNCSCNGPNVHGGGLSVSVMARSWADRSWIGGCTTVIKTIYTISSNTLTNCIAASVSDFFFGNVYGGGMSVDVGAFSAGSKSTILGNTRVNTSMCTISSNTLTNCQAILSKSNHRNPEGENVYGGGISVAVGAYSFSSSFGGYGSSGSGSSDVSGNTTVSSTRYSISGNTLTNCSATSVSGRSNGANVYGGGVSVAVGAYSYSFGGGLSSSSSSSDVSGSTMVSSTRYSISGNTLTNCSATTSVIVISNGANAYGGGVSVAVGAYSYSGAISSSSSSIGIVSGSTMVSDTSYDISSDMLTNCGAASVSVSSNGANVYGGGMSVAVGAYSYSYSSSGSSSSLVLDSLTIKNTSVIISSNTLTNCSATSVSGRSNGANAYGGGVSVAVGAYSYSGAISSSSSSIGAVSGSTMVSDTSYDISSDMLTNCGAASVSVSSNGANVYGGGMSVAVGAYSYCWIESSALSSSSSDVSGNTIVSTTSYIISVITLTSCSVLSETSGTSNGASAYGGALSFVHNASLFPLSSVQSVAPVIGVSSVLRVNNCSFLHLKSATASTSCAAGASNVAGGAVFALVPSLVVDVIASVFTNATASTSCAASSSSTYSLGGGMSIFQAGNVKVTSTKFTRCRAQGVPQSTNVFVSGGGLHIQASDSFLFQNGSITDCSVRDAFSTFLQCGGGALGTQNISFIRISDSIFRDNSDSSSSGSIVLQHFKDDLGMNVTMDRSLVLVQPSNTPALNISCGNNCSQLLQQRIKIWVKKINISAYSESRALQYDSSALMSQPASSVMYSDRYSSLNCLFNFTNNGAIVITNTGSNFLTFFCAPCARPFEIAQTSRTLDFSNHQNVTNLGQMVCKTIPSTNLQQCPYGVAFCSTIVNISVGFWASFSADGILSFATRCPRNYCGCRNIPDYRDPFCQLEPPLSPRFEADVHVSDNLCNGNRTGVLCGGCKLGFTQSLDGYSCVRNDDCIVGWTWAVSIIGYFIYSLYIVISALQDSDGLISCLLFYGQMSSFAIVSQPVSTGSDVQSAKISEWFSQVSQFNSIASARSQTCYGIGMGAYETTAAHLSGPAIVLLLAIAITLFLMRTKDFFLRREIHFSVSISATLALTFVLFFSSIITVAIQLIACVDINGDHVVFIDGTHKCYDAKWSGLVAVVVILCLFPVALPFAMRSKQLPHDMRAALCGSYLETRFYWGAVTLLFRFVLSAVSAFTLRYPTTAAVIQCAICVAMLVILVHQKPYRHAVTYFFDIFCHYFLVVQFVLVSVLSLVESFGIVSPESNPLFRTERAAVASVVIRYAKGIHKSYALTFFV